MIVYFAKACTDSGRICTGSCDIDDFSEQEAALATVEHPGTEFAVQTERAYAPKELHLDKTTWTIRDVKGMDVAQPTMTRARIREIVSSLAAQSKSADHIVSVLAAKSFRQIKSILDDAGLST